MKYVECQFLLSIACAAHWNAIISSGAYRQRKIQRGTDAKDANGLWTWRDLTDDEKLADAVAIAARHIQFAQECADAMDGDEDGEKP